MWPSFKVIEALKEKSSFHPIDCFGRNRKSRKSIYFGNEDESKDLEVNPKSERGMALLVVSLSVLPCVQKDLRCWLTTVCARESKLFLNHTKRLRREKQTISKRALFYLYPGLFETQAIIDYAIGNCPYNLSHPNLRTTDWVSTDGMNEINLL